jgi:WD40 repeat protein
MKIHRAARWNFKVFSAIWAALLVLIINSNSACSNSSRFFKTETVQPVILQDVQHIYGPSADVSQPAGLGGLYSIQYANFTAQGDRYLQLKLRAQCDGCYQVVLANAQGEQLTQIEIPDVKSVWLSPDLERIVTSSTSRGFQSHTFLWDLQGHQLAEVFPSDDTYGQIQFNATTKRILVTGVTYSPPENLMETETSQISVSGIYPSSTKLYDYQGNILAEFKGLVVPDPKSQPIAQFSPDGQHILTRQFGNLHDIHAYLWNSQGQQIAILEHGEHSIKSEDFSPNSQQIVTGAANGTATLWNLQGKELLTFQASQHSLSVVKFSADGKHIATGDSNGSVQLWDLQGRLMLSFDAHTPKRVRTITFSPDNKFIATTGDDRNLHLWNERGSHFGSLKEGVIDPGAVVQFSSDSQQIANGIYLWHWSGK